MQIILNGKTTDIAPDLTAAALLRQLGAAPERTAIVVNDAIIAKAERERHRLQPEDRVEILTFAAGG